MDERDRLLDAAVEVVADGGVAGLTHAAVDARAGSPPGSAVALFATSAALLEGVVDRCVERELEMASGPSGTVATPSGVAAAFGAVVRGAVGEHRSVTMTRYALQAEVARRPELRGHYAVGADEVDSWAVDLLRRAGSAHPERDYDVLANYITGVVFHELALPSPRDPGDRVRAVIDALGWSTP
jgi:DNA-binding transcriptional regulator YbjK